MPTVREFVRQSYRLISANSPTVPLHGDDQAMAIEILNQLLSSYAATGLMLTIGRTVTIPLTAGQGILTCGPATFVPTPDITAGRLATFENAWLTLTGVDYPLINETRPEFLAAWKYNPLQGLPRFIIVYQETEITRLQLYPAPSQFFDFFLRGKFQLTALTSNDTMDGLPGYYMRFLLLALARDVAFYKGRSEAWTPKLEARYLEAEQIMEAASEVNLSLTGDKASLLNGAWRVRAGI